MANLLLPIQAGTLPQGYCFSTWQDLLNDFADNMQAVLANGRSFYNVGPTKPAPEFQAYPWLRTTDGRWYTFNGVWRAPNNYSVDERRLYVGTEASLVTYDGGSAGVVSDTTGPMWQRDTDFNDRIPMGVGSTVANPGVNGGAATHTLTEAEGGNGVHTHAFGVCDPASDDAVFRRVGLSNVAGYQGHYVVGGGTQNNPVESTANLFTLPSGSGGAGVPSPTPFSIIPPVIGVFVIKPSGRLYYVVP